MSKTNGERTQHSPERKRREEQTKKNGAEKYIKWAQSRIIFFSVYFSLYVMRAEEEEEAEKTCASVSIDCVLPPGCSLLHVSHQRNTFIGSGVARLLVTRQPRRRQQWWWCCRLPTADLLFLFHFIFFPLGLVAVRVQRLSEKTDTDFPRVIVRQALNQIKPSTEQGKKEKVEERARERREKNAKMNTKFKCMMELVFLFFKFLFHFFSFYFSARRILTRVRSTWSLSSAFFCLLSPQFLLNGVGAW